MPVCSPASSLCLLFRIQVSFYLLIALASVIGFLVFSMGRHTNIVTGSCSDFSSFLCHPEKQSAGLVQWKGLVWNQEIRAVFPSGGRSSLYQVKETKLNGSLYWEEANAHLKKQTLKATVTLPLCSWRKLVLQLQWVHSQSPEEAGDNVEEIEISRYPKV